MGFAWMMEVLIPRSCLADLAKSVQDPDLAAVTEAMSDCRPRDLNVESEEYLVGDTGAG